MLKKGKYNAREIARYIINRSNELVKIDDSHHIFITNLKLQKLLYFVQAIFLINLKQACFTDKILAWELGPVVRDVYDIYKYHGLCRLYSKKVDNSNISDEDKRYIDCIIEYFKDYSTQDLTDLTHMQDPWKKVYKNGKGQNKEIKNKAIYKYFKRQVANN